MADIEIKIPSLGESENEATIVSWLKGEGDAVAVDDVLAEIESDKITMEITAVDAGVLKKIFKQEGETVEPGEVVALVDDSAAAAKKPEDAEKPSEEPQQPVQEVTPEQEAEEPTSQKPQVEEAESASTESDASEKAERVVQLKTETPPVSAGRIEERVAMSGLRKRIATRLKGAQNTAAMLTTFNEVNMQPVMDLRARYKDSFKARHGVGLGFMSFFAKACVHASASFPAVNAYIDGDEIVYHNYMDMGVAVSTEKGLVVPVLRDVGQLGFAGIEQGIADLAVRAREGGLNPDDLKGGTFSITNGGVFGSMLSTPIINPPQSAILGMHAINKRPVVENDQIVIRPMMYLALTYDHRLIDGREAVQFLVAVKEFLEMPAVALLDL